jgi:formate C-acetyltransferase
MDALTEAFCAKLGERIRSNFEEQNALRIHRAAHSMNPLLSCFVNDCLARGTDIEQGGAKYNWIMPSFVGMGNLVDALYAIRTLVFDRGELTIGEYKAILDKNFEGHEELRRHILSDIPKYGNDNDDIDVLFDGITRFITGECRKYTPVLPNARLVPSVFCWVMHERFGRETGATPDGRQAGFPLGDGSGPCQGREACGPTASILSSTKWSHKEFIGGVAVNLKFSKKMFREQSREALLGLIRTYLARGGFELQINVVDHETLQKARENPENYRDLVVRIGGYSDYFVRLSPNMQAEVIYRTEHIL